MDALLLTASQELADCLFKHQRKLVCVESCTAGLIAAALGTVPGVSAVFCGSAVVYRATTKHAWLKIPDELLTQVGTVSPLISRSLANQVLELTLEADVALGITGHLGPDAPSSLDGTCYLAIASHLRSSREPPAAIMDEHMRASTAQDAVRMQQTSEGWLLEFTLPHQPNMTAREQRIWRQHRAAWHALVWATRYLQSSF